MLGNLIRDMFGRPVPEAAGNDAATPELLAVKELLAQNRFGEVLDTLTPYLEHRPDNAEARFMRGTAQLELQRTAEARVDLARAAQLSPREARYLYNLALTHWIEGDVDRTMQLCRQAVEINGFALAHLLLANIELHGEDYFRVLARMHAHLKPRTYVEVGVFRGWSMRMVPPQTQAIGIDPEPRLDQPPGPNQRVVAQTSDDFFAQHDVIAELGNRRIELAFIDGMHQFEYALRDFINIERLCNPDSVILVHDCYPLDRQTAERDRSTAFWSGDIWRLILLLRKYRPDLGVRTISTPPTGLGMIFNLDPSSRVLHDRLDEIVAEYLALDYGTLDSGKRNLLNAVPNDWDGIAALLDSRRRSA